MRNKNKMQLLILALSENSVCDDRRRGDFSVRRTGGSVQPGSYGFDGLVGRRLSGILPVRGCGSRRRGSGQRSRDREAGQDSF